VGKLKATAKAAEKAVDKVAELVRLGYPESTAKKIVSGELPMDQASRMARAREQGFDVDQTYYHGRQSDFLEFAPTHSDARGYWLTDSADDASTFSRKRGGAGANVMPVYARGDARNVDMAGSPFSPARLNEYLDASPSNDLVFSDIDNFRRNRTSTTRVVRDPSNIRSTNAAFDPDQKDSSNLLAGLGAGAVGLGLMGQSEDADAVPIVKAGRRMIEAYHGSPHKFDKFSMENIGTGEGAQAYGHGLYFADSEDVAKEYQQRLTDYRVSVDGRAMEPIRQDFSHLSDDDALAARAIVNSVFADPRKTGVDGLRESLADQKAMYADALESASPEDAAFIADEIAGIDRQIALIDSGRVSEPKGALYRAHIDVDPDTLLDWDKPLSDQSESIQEAVKSSLVSRTLDEMGDDEFYSVMQNIDPNGAWSPEDQMDELGEVLSKDDLIANLREYSPDLLAEVEDYLSADFDPAMSGASLYRQATAQRGGGSVMSNKAQAEVSRKLHEAGIPGIRYADGMSRGKDGGTYNYVMFDDKPISIQERGNVDPTLLAATGGTSAIGLAASQFLQNRQQKQSQWESLRSDLLNTVTSVDRAIGKGFEALEMPWRGLLGLNRTVAGLLYGEGTQAVQEGARVAQQPVEQTAYDMGGVATDASGSPVVGAAVNTMVNLGGPI
jgi:hypothetical protein